MNALFHDLQTFMLNLFIILILFFLYHIFIEKRINQVTHMVLIGFISGFSIMLCMTFPISPVSGFIFDMRQVPFIIGSLYGGRKVALFLLLVLLSYRFYIGIDHGFYASLIIYSTLFVCLWFLIPLFHKANKIKQKVYISILISMIVFLLLFSTVSIFNPLINLRYIILLFLLYMTQYCGIALFVFFLEKAKKDMLIINELKSLERLKIVSEIAASISHEVRNPLTVTRGFIQLLTDSTLSEEKKKLYIQLSLSELDRAEHIISDYLTFAKPSLEHLALIELNKEFDYMIKVVTPYATMSNVQIEFINGKTTHIIGEPQKLHQCMINIMKNGIEAMEDGGLLSIELIEKNETVTIVITDTGKGMTAEQVRRLGTPYYSTKEKGTGLGTMVVYSIIKMMRGTIDVYSEPGEGTQFVISLPVASTAQENR